jgi:hypothetical protein
MFGATNFYVYDYKLFDVVKKDGKYFFGPKLEAQRLLRSLPRENLLWKTKADETEKEEVRK